MKSQNNLLALPKGWEIATVEDLATKVQYGTSAKANEDSIGIPVIRMGNIINGNLICETLKYLPHTHDEFPDLLLEKGDVLFNRTNSAELVGKTAVYKGFPTPCSFASYLIRVHLVNKYHPDLLAYYINSVFGRKWISTVVSQQVGQANVNGTKLQALLVPVPPLAEQERIVAKIEELFTKLDAGVASLKAAKAQLKRYRQAVLKAAVEGELTCVWRKQHKEKSLVSIPKYSPTIINSRKRAGRLWGAGMVPTLTEEERALLPEGWIWVKVKSLGPDPDNVVQVGPMSMRSQDFEPTGVPVLNVGCVKWGYFDESKLDFMPEAKASDFNRYRIKSNDILFTRSGTVGRCAVAKTHQEGWLMTFHLLRVRTDSNACLPQYLRMVFEGASHIKRQVNTASIGSTRAGFNTNLLAMLDVPLPSVTEQHQIIAEVERRLSIADEIETSLNAELKRAESLRQSILKRAFEGKLVPQDPNDEPASVLLERIKAEKSEKISQAFNGKRKTRRRKSSAAADEPTLPLK